MESTDGLTKIFFDLDPDDWHGRVSESLWAKPLPGGAGQNLFELRNSPFFARGVSFLDVVRAARAHDQGWDFSGVAEPSGHSTYRLLVKPGCPAFKAWLQPMLQLGCTYESGTLETAQGKRDLYALDVLPSADIYAVYETLSEGERQEVWLFEEGHVGHDLRR